MPSQSMKIRMDALDEFRNDKRYPTLSEIPFSQIDFEEDRISLNCWANNILQQHMTTIKSAFGPLKFTEGMNPGAKNAEGTLTIREGLTVSVTVYGAMSCKEEKIPEDGPTPAQVDKLVEGAKSGKFVLTSCSSLENADPEKFCKKAGCYKETWGAPYCGNHLKWGMAYGEKCRNDSQW